MLKKQAVLILKAKTKGNLACIQFVEQITKAKLIVLSRRQQIYIQAFLDHQKYTKDQYYIQIFTRNNKQPLDPFAVSALQKFPNWNYVDGTNTKFKAPHSMVLQITQVPHIQLLALFTVHISMPSAIVLLLSRVNFSISLMAHLEAFNKLQSTAKVKKKLSYVFIYREQFEFLTY